MSKGAGGVGRTDVKVVLAAESTLVLRFVDAATGEPVLVTKSEFAAWPSGTTGPEAPDRKSSSSAPYGTERVTVPSGSRWDVLVRTPGCEDARLTGIDVPDVAETTVDVPLRRSR